MDSPNFFEFFVPLVLGTVFFVFLFDFLHFLLSTTTTDDTTNDVAADNNDKTAIDNADSVDGDDGYKKLLNKMKRDH